MSEQALNCPHCGGRVPVPAGAGASVTCPFCNSAVAVPFAAQKQKTPPNAVSPVLPPAAQMYAYRPAPPPEPAPKPRKSSGPSLGQFIFFGLGACVIIAGCCMMTTLIPTLNRSHIVVSNQTGATICSVRINSSSVRTYGTEYLRGDSIEAGGTQRLATSFSPGQYDLRAYDCDMKVLASDKDVEVPTGDFTWTASSQ